jgi:hypothetical protein
VIPLSMKTNRLCTAGVLVLVAGVTSLPLHAQQRENASSSARVHLLGHALLQTSRDLGTMGKALIDTPDWQLTVDLRAISERATNYCAAIEDLLVVQEMVSDRRDRERIGEFIRSQVRTFYAPMINEEILGILPARARAKSSGLARAADVLGVQLKATNDSLTAILPP